MMRTLIRRFTSVVLGASVTFSAVAGTAAGADTVDASNAPAQSTEHARAQVVGPATQQANGQANGHAKRHSRSNRSGPGRSRSVVDVKFVEGTDVRVRGNKLTTAAGGAIPALDAVLGQFPGVSAERTFIGASEAELEHNVADAARKSGRPQADLNLFFRLHLGPQSDIDEVIDALSALDMVQEASASALSQEPAATPSYVPYQGYRTAASPGSGVDAEYAKSIPGGKGENIRITDIEYTWNTNHEDLSKARATGATLSHKTACDPHPEDNANHGTAVLGEIAGDDNGSGVTGLAPGASIHMVNAAAWNASGQCQSYIASAINTAANASSAGDVILIEQQWPGPNFIRGSASQYGLVPVEWDLDAWGAIRNATDRGVIVVEAAGNGSQNLDDPIYNDANGDNWFSVNPSGAILVGAGNPPNCKNTAVRGRLDFSNYGSALDLQGWGACVTTTGYGNLQGGTNRNLWYTQGFSGTSSASPIVASSVGIISSIAKDRAKTVTAEYVRSVLRTTGQAQQYGNDGAIGPLPNLRAAIDSLGPKITDGGHVLGTGKLTGTTVPVVQTWSSVTGGTYDVWLKTDAGSWVRQTLSNTSSRSATFNLERGRSYQFAARAKTANTMWGNWVYGKSFSLGEYQENYTTTNPAYTGTWTRVAYQSGSDGYVTLSSTSGDKVKFSFTGTSVAWVASKATNRGKADVYVDNVFVETVDLYSATTAPQSIVFRKNWATSGAHTLEVRVQGTSGRPKVDVDAFVRLQ